MRTSWIIYLVSFVLESKDCFLLILYFIETLPWLATLPALQIAVYLPRFSFYLSSYSFTLFLCLTRYSLPISFL